jgi:uncharacterized GH25 family protein
VSRAALALALVLGLGLGSAGALQAHDFWIVPSTFHPQPGTTVAVGLRVGQQFMGDPVPRTSQAIERFFVRQAGGEEPIDGIENTDPAGWLRADGQGTAVIAYESRGTEIELPAAKFEDYLRQEGLERILRLRQQRGERAEPGRERFFRYAKALLAGRRPSAAATRPVGLRYEIVPTADPTRGGSVLRGKVLFEGDPLPGARVVAMLWNAPGVRLIQRSDRQGAFAFTLPRAGVWLIKSVHMVRASWLSSADWESLWASLTFEVPAARSLLTQGQ